MPDQHAFLSPSGAKLWLHSPGCWYEEAPELTEEEQAFIDQFRPPSTAADEGTLGHEIVERLLRREYDIEPKKARPLRKLRKSKFYSYELERRATWSANQAIEIIDNYEGAIDNLAFEQRVHCKKIHEELWGTSDVVIVAGNVLHIVDFKFGRLPIHAADNPQLAIYAYGAMETLDLWGKVDTIRGTIVQPRNYDIDETTFTAKALRKWGRRTVKPAAKATANRTGPMDPSVETCRYCKHRVTDAKHRQVFLEAIGGIDAMTKDLTKMDLEEIEAIAANAPALKQWLDDVTRFAQAKAYSGHKFKRVKLVRGVERRAFTDQKRVARRLKRLGLQQEQYMKEPTIKPLTEIEALLGKTKFNNTLGPLITKHENQPRLVSIDSKEKPYTPDVNKAADEFGL